MDDDNRCKQLFRVIPILLGLTLLFSCRAEVEKIKELPNLQELPAAYATDVETVYSDSAIVRLKIQAPELKEFPLDSLREPQIEFPQGLTATFFNQSGAIESILTARYAIYFKTRKQFEARHEVRVRNFTQDQELEAELLFWDELKEEIWSDSAVVIKTSRGITYGDNGFFADQNFTRYQIRKSRGQMTVEIGDSTSNR